MRYNQTIKNLLVCLGAYYLSLWATLPVGVLLGKVTSRIIYDDGVFSAISMGIVVSFGRTFAALLAAVLILVFVDELNGVRWIFIILALYLIFPRIHRGGYAVPPTWWDQLEWRVERNFPAFACVACAYIILYLYRKHKRGNTPDLAQV